MIVRDHELQMLYCSICDELQSLTRKQISEPETMFELVEAFTADHAGCEQWKHDPERAQRERGVKRRMCREFKKLEAGKTQFMERTRCHGRRSA